jgi:hypothetical protein
MIHDCQPCYYDRSAAPILAIPVDGRATDARTTRFQRHRLRRAIIVSRLNSKFNFQWQQLKRSTGMGRSQRTAGDPRGAYYLEARSSSNHRQNAPQCSPESFRLGASPRDLGRVPRSLRLVLRSISIEHDCDYSSGSVVSGISKPSLFWTAQAGRPMRRTRRAPRPRQWRVCTK